MLPCLPVVGRVGSPARLIRFSLRLRPPFRLAPARPARPVRRVPLRPARSACPARFGLPSATVLQSLFFLFRRTADEAERRLLLFQKKSYLCPDETNLL